LITSSGKVNIQIIISEGSDTVAAVIVLSTRDRQLWLLAPPPASMYWSYWKRWRSSCWLQIWI